MTSRVSDTDVVVCGSVMKMIHAIYPSHHPQKTYRIFTCSISLLVSRRSRTSKRLPQSCKCNVECARRSIFAYGRKEVTLRLCREGKDNEDVFHPFECTAGSRLISPGGAQRLREMNRVDCVLISGCACAKFDRARFGIAETSSYLSALGKVLWTKHINTAALIFSQTLVEWRLVQSHGFSTQVKSPLVNLPVRLYSCRRWIHLYTSPVTQKSAFVAPVRVVETWFSFFWTTERLCRSQM